MSARRQVYSLFGENVEKRISLFKNLREISFPIFLPLFVENFPPAAKFRAFLQWLRHVNAPAYSLLRGGLKFCLREALFHAYGFNNHASSFMTSQRYMADGKWHIKENQYRKLKVPENATLLVGDVVATGATIEEGFNVFLDYLRTNRSRLDNLIFFTSGCHNAERILKQVDQRLRRMNPTHGRTIVVYMEGKFKVAEENSNLRIKIPGTDLLRTDALVTPEFALSQYEDVAYPIERCTIYDAGSRSFDRPEYLHDKVGRARVGSV